MIFQIYAKNLDLPLELKDNLEAKLQKVSLRIKKIISARVDISRDRHHRKGDVLRVEINLRLPRKLLRAIAQESQIESSFDLALKKINKQIERYKERKE